VKSTLRDARVDAAVERASKPKPKRRVTPKPVEPSRYPRLAYNSDKLGTLVHGHQFAAHDKRERVKANRKLRETSPLIARIKAPGPHRRAIRKWYRANVVGKLTIVSRAAALLKGTRTSERRKAAA
jgi:hypothetical protein